MKSNQPPRLAVAILERSVADDALVGDLIEEFARGRSRGWFWIQTLSAVWLKGRRRSLEIRPLRLVDNPSLLSLADTRLPLKVNMSAGPSGRVGGLGLAALVVLLWPLAREAWWLLPAGILGGALVGIVLVANGRHHKPSDDATALHLHG